MNITLLSWLSWLLLGLIFILLELMNPGVFLIFFGIGALLSALTCYMFDISLVVQVLIFLITSIASLITLRKYLKDKMFSRSNKSPLDMDDELVGTIVRVENIIIHGEPGKVMYKGSLWTAQSDETINPGELAEIIGQKSITLIVKKKHESFINK